MVVEQHIPTIAFHEVANLFPLIEGKEFDDLVEDIRANGLKEPIWTHQDKIIDGRNRYRACVSAGVEPRFQEWDGKGSLTAFSVSLNIKRRHLTSSQLALISLSVERQLAEEAARRQNLGQKVDQGSTGRSAHQAADLLHTNHDYVSAAKKIERDAPELLPHVMAGTLTIPDAKAIADLPRERQSAVVEKAVKAKEEKQKRVSSAVKNAVKEAKATAKREERSELLQQTSADADHYRIYHCDIAMMHEQVPANSLDCIITDPPYPHEYLPLYAELSQFAHYALKPGGSLLVMAGQSYLPQVINALCEHMNYHWTLSYLTPGGQSAQLWLKKVNTFWKPLLWFTNGIYIGDWIGDVCKSNVNDNDKRHHSWGQSESGMADIIERFSLPGQTICDPFLGGGTTAVVSASLKRYFIGCDIDASCVQTSLQRVQEVLSERV